MTPCLEPLAFSAHQGCRVLSTAGNDSDGHWTCRLSDIHCQDVPDDSESSPVLTSKGHDENIAPCSWFGNMRYHLYGRHCITQFREEPRDEYSSSLDDAIIRIRWPECRFDTLECAKLSILNDWAIALSSDHARGVVHGNITPDSVSIALGRGILNPLVLSQPRMHRTRESMLADATDLSGVRWAATEFFRLDNGDLHPTKMSDVYSFGCLILQVLTESVPYCATKRSEQVVYLKYLGREPIDKQTPKVANHHVAFMRWCWSPEPEKRPSMETVVDFLQGEIDKLVEQRN